MSHHATTVSAEELEYRTIRRTDLVPDEAAFIDTRLPGSDRKLNYPLIGAGVSENAAQAIPVIEPHGFSLGAAVMPAGVTNSLHLHFTAEVFMCFGGEWQFRWGPDGTQGEAIVREGDVISIPTWMFRGFTSKADDAWLYTALGRDRSGGLIWGPSVLDRAAEYGMYLGIDNRIIQTKPGAAPPEGVERVAPLTEKDLDALRVVTEGEMRQRLATPEDLVWCATPFLDSTLPSGGAELAIVVGYGLTEDRVQQPRVHEPHGLTVAWLRAYPGRGMSSHRHEHAQAVIVKQGRWRLTLNTGADETVVEVGEYDTVSIPVGAWRRFESIGDQPGQLAVITEGDGKVAIEWAPDVVAAAREHDVAHDANGYVAPAHLVAQG